jgi:hypothetical protein
VHVTIASKNTLNNINHKKRFKFHLTIMSKILLFCCLAMLSFIGVQAQSPVAKVDSVGYLPETICRVSVIGGIYTLIPEDNKNMRYAPVNMTTTYQKEEVLVRVSGVVGAIPPNVRMIGTPFFIRSIEFAESVTGGVKPSKPTTGGVKPSKPTTGGVKPSKDTAIEYSTAVKNVRGTVRHIANDQYVIETTDGRYLPDKLSKELKKEGMRVRFWGKVGKLPPNARLLGTPLQISKIMKDRKVVKKDKSPKGTRAVKQK